MRGFQTPTGVLQKVKKAGRDNELPIRNYGNWRNRMCAGKYKEFRKVEREPVGQWSAMKRQQGSDHEALDPFLSTFHSILLATEYGKTIKKEGGYSICC